MAPPTASETLIPCLFFCHLHCLWWRAVPHTTFQVEHLSSSVNIHHLNLHLPSLAPLEAYADRLHNLLEYINQSAYQQENLNSTCQFDGIQHLSFTKLPFACRNFLAKPACWFLSQTNINIIRCASSHFTHVLLTPVLVRLEGCSLLSSFFHWPLRPGSPFPPL